MAELDAALERGDLPFAITLAEEVARDRGKPIDLAVALRFLPLVIAHRPGEFDTWSLRWLGRWISETPGAKIEQAAEVAAALADLPSEPVAAIEAIRANAPGSRATRG